MKKQILKNLFSNYLGAFLGLALSFFLVPFLIKKLGRDGFGLTVLAESMILLSQVFVFAVRIALARFVTISFSSGKEQEGFEYLSTGRQIFYYFVAAALILGGLLSYFFPIVFNVPEIFRNQSRVMASLIVFAFAITIPNLVYWVVLYAHQRFDYINMANYGGTILRASCIFILFSLLPPEHVNITTYALVYLLMTWGQNFIVYKLARFIMPQLKLRGMGFNKTKAKEVLSFSAYSSLGNIASSLCENSINILINLSLGPAANAVYAVGAKVPGIVRRLFLEPSWSLTPSVTDMVARRDYGKIAVFFRAYSKFLNLLVSPVCLFLVIYSKDFIRLWLGEGFEPAPQVLAILSASLIFSIQAYCCSSITIAYGAIRVPAIGGVIIGVVDVLASIVVVFILGWGLVGLAWVALLLNFFWSLFFMPFYVCRITGFSTWGHFYHAIIKPLALSILSFGIIPLFILGKFGVGAVIVLPVAIIPYVWIAYVYIFSSEEQGMIKTVFEKVSLKMGFSNADD